MTKLRPVLTPGADPDSRKTLKLHGMAESGRRPSGRPGRTGWSACGQLVLDQEGANDRRAARGESPLDFDDLPPCKACGMHIACRKVVVYPDRATADAALVRIGKSEARTMAKAERRAYYCQDHKGWHLTSKR